MPAIDRLLTMMIEQKASDLHLSSQTKPKLRLHGQIVDIESAKEPGAEAVLQLLEEIMPEKNKVEFKEKWDTDFAYEISGLARFRANIFMDHKGPGAVFRQIPAKILSFDDLKLPPVIRNLCQIPKGLVLVTGPTGSGKSTTLAAMIDFINEHHAGHIITIEDPIEFVHPNKKCLVNQREIRRHTTGFKSALRAALREDPDIVLVGEMRDLETTEIALETAETGHVVFGTLHTNSAMATVDRIINQFPTDRQTQIRLMLAESLKGVVSQSLLRKADGKGRVAALEILVTTAAISSNIREGKCHQILSSMQTGKRFGMQLLNDELVRLVKEKTVSVEEAYLKAADKDDLVARLRVLGIETPTSEKSVH